jgi:V/A-type H+-transporting ATPase subunit K
MKVCKINSGKRKFYILLGIFQVFLVLTVVLSTNAIMALATEGVIMESNDFDVAKWLAVSAAAAVGSSVLGAGYAIKTTGTAAISSLSEKPEEFFKAFLVVALGEALAVYGLIVAILLWTKIPDLQ